MRLIFKKMYYILKKYYWFNKLEYILNLKSYMNIKNKLYFSKCGNFGDELNNDLMIYYKIQYIHARPLGANICCIGSNLQEFVSSNPKPVSKNHTLNVLGSGFIDIEHGNEKFIFNTQIYALRGRLSKQRCQKILNKKLNGIALGDPGLLIKRMFPNVRLSGEYDVGIICHMVDKDSTLLRKISLTNYKVLFIDIEQDPKSFVEEVAKCNFVLSSAMHGLICADSLGIPNKHIVLSNKVVGGEYKFRDYYSVFPNFIYDPVYLKDCFINYKKIDEFKLDYNITNSEVEVICNNLESAFNNFKQGF